MDTDVRVLEAQPFFTRETPRTPLKFGGVVMDKVVYCHVRVLVENRRGRRAEGWGAIFLSDVWAWPKCPASRDGVEAVMQEMVSGWCRRVAENREFGHPVDLFWQVEPDLMRVAEAASQKHGLEETMPRMAALVCASPADAAIHDAFGAAAGICTYDGYGKEHTEHDLSTWLGAGFRGKYIAEYLRPLPRWVEAFHLVGGLDKLREGEITADDPRDELPVSLDQWIRYEGVCCLKVKLVGNDMSWDLDRLLSVVAVAREEHAKLGIERMWLTADTNEMCESPAYMIELLELFKEKDARAFDDLLYVEQPCSRDLRRDMFDVRELAAIKPTLVDEALGSIEDFELALELGYSGGALKSCKCQSEQLLLVAKSTELGLPMAVQDLTNPGIALLHSVGLAGRIHTIRGVESNSRQFYPATSEPEKRVHPGVYRLDQGRIDTSTIRGPGLGYRWDEIGREFE